MDTREVIKIVAVLFLYGVFAPVTGFILKYSPRGQQWTFGLLCFLTIGGIFGAADWGITLQYFEYRGHARGYHFYFAEVVALTLLFARVFSSWKNFRILPPGLWLYFLYCAVSFISIINAPAPSYVLMAACKFVKMAIILVAAYNFLRKEEDIRFFLTTMCVTMFWQLVVVLKMKYMDGYYQVPGTFEHQNSLSMFTTMIGMVFLAVALGPKGPRSNLYLFAFIVCAVIQQATLSRAGLAIFAGATIFVTVFSLIEKFTLRRVTVLASLAAVGAIGLFMTIDTIILRFNDESNMASRKTRELLNEASSHMLEDYALGVGWNNFGLVINKPYPYGDVIDRWEREGGARVDETHKKGIAESLYYLLLAETGYQGFLSYLLLITIFLWRNVRGFFFYRYHFLGSLSMGIFAGCFFNYIHSTLERVLTQPRNLMLWMLLLAITARIHTWRKEEKKRRAIGEGMASTQQEPEYASFSH